MIDPIKFLLTKADELRALSNWWPDIANDLRRMADECEDEIARLREDGDLREAD
jgi:hypothetical protein